MEEKFERVKKLEKLLSTPLTELIPKQYKDFKELYSTICELVGRKVFPCELAFPDMLYKEILSKEEREWVSVARITKVKEKYFYVRVPVKAVEILKIPTSVKYFEIFVDKKEREIIFKPGPTI